DSLGHDDWHSPTCPLQRWCSRADTRQDGLWTKRNQFLRRFAQVHGIAWRPPIIDPHITANGPTKFLQPLHEGCQARLCFWLARTRIHQHADASHALLPARCQRPRRRAAEQRDELAPLQLRDHSITSSARASSVGGIPMPSALAVARFTIRSNLGGCCTRMVAAFAPSRIFSTEAPARRDRLGEVRDIGLS